MRPPDATVDGGPSPATTRSPGRRCRPIAPSVWHLDRLASTVTVEILNASATDVASARRAVEAAGGTIVDTAPSGVMLARVPAVTVGEARRRSRRTGSAGPSISTCARNRSSPDGLRTHVGFGGRHHERRRLARRRDSPAPASRSASSTSSTSTPTGTSARWARHRSPTSRRAASRRVSDCSGEFFDGIDGGGDDHGPAVVEIVKDMAPGAQIYIGRASTESDYYALVDWFADQGVRVISRSLGSRYDGPGDGRGALDGVADHAVDRGITWINSGGNNAINRYYRAPVRLIGTSVAFGAAGSDTWLRFNGCIAPGGVRWANDWDVPPAQRTDYDVFLYHSPIGSPSTNDLVDSATADQTSGAPPLEIIQGSACPAPGNAFYMRIEHVTGDPIRRRDRDPRLRRRDGSSTSRPRSRPPRRSSTPRNAGVIAVGAVDPPAVRIARHLQLAGADQRRAHQARSVGRVGVRQHDVRQPSSPAPARRRRSSPAVPRCCSAPTWPPAHASSATCCATRSSTAGRAAPTTSTAPASSASRRRRRRPSRTNRRGTCRSRSPTRILDTRPSGPIGPSNLVGTLWPGEILDVPIAGVAGIPASGVTAVAINLTLVGAARTGYGQALPTLAAPVGAFSSFNLDAAPQTRPNFAIVPIGQGGSISVYSNTGGNAIIDVLGYFTAAGGAVDRRPVRRSRHVAARARHAPRRQPPAAGDRWHDQLRAADRRAGEPDRGARRQHHRHGDDRRGIRAGLPRRQQRRHLQDVDAQPHRRGARRPTRSSCRSPRPASACSPISAPAAART